MKRNMLKITDLCNFLKTSETLASYIQHTKGTFLNRTSMQPRFSWVRNGRHLTKWQPHVIPAYLNGILYKVIENNYIKHDNFHKYVSATTRFLKKKPVNM